jgi:hypothetical protein
VTRKRQMRAFPRERSAAERRLRLRERYQDWDRGPFTVESQDHMSVSEVTAAPAG